MLRVAVVALVLAQGWVVQAQETRGVLLVAPTVPADAAQALEQRLAARHAPVERVAPAQPPEPVPEQVLAEVRPLYGSMNFKAAAAKLDAAEETIIASRLPSPAVLRALADVELWLGALLLLEHDAAGAAERFQLALRLQPGARPDRIFPPEVAQAFAQARSQPARVQTAVRVAPAGARLWLDGKPVGAVPQVAAAPGLHYVVVERADKQPLARMVRLPRSAPEIAANLTDAADATTALRSAAERLRIGDRLARDEGLGVSAAIERPLWVLRATGGRLELERFAAGDASRPTAEVSEPIGEATALGDDLCTVEPGCAAAPSIALTAPPPPPPKKPLYKRGWFWGVLGTTVVVLAGGAAGLAIGLTQPRDYVVHIH